MAACAIQANELNDAGLGVLNGAGRLFDGSETIDADLALKLFMQLDKLLPASLYAFGILNRAICCG